MIRSVRFSALFLMTVGLLPLRPQEWQPAHEMLDRALRLADLYNWDDAGKEFAEAETLFLAAGDQRNALYAKLGKNPVNRRSASTARYCGSSSLLNWTTIRCCKRTSNSGCSVSS